MTARPSLGEWVGFIRSLTSDLNPLRLEARLASQRAVLRDALTLSGRAAEAAALDRAATAYALASVPIEDLGRAGEAVEANRAAHGPRRDLSPAGQLAAEAAKAEILLEQAQTDRTRRAGAALLGRADKLMAAMEGRLTRARAQLEPFAQRYVDPSGERAVLFRSLLDGWDRDLETLGMLRAGLLAAPLDRERIARLRHGESLVARLFKEGMLTEEGLKARLAQARSLLANEHKPVRRIRARGRIVLAEMVDVWDPRWADTVADAERYLGDIGQRSDSMLLNPPGRGLPKPRPFRAGEAAAETRWLARSGQIDAAAQALCFYAPRLSRSDTIDPLWLGLAASLRQPAIAARLAVAGLVAANGDLHAADRRIDRIVWLCARAADDAFAQAVAAQGGRDPERACAAAFVLAAIGRPQAALTLSAGVADEGACGALFFRLARACAPPSAVGPGAVLAVDAASAAWAAGLPGLAGREIVLAEVGAGAAPGPRRLAQAEAAVESLASTLAACGIAAAPAVVGPPMVRALAGRMAACERLWRELRSGAAPALVALGVDAAEDGLVPPFRRDETPAVFGVGASAVRVHRLSARSDADRRVPALTARRILLMQRSYEAFRVGCGEHAAGAAPGPAALLLDPWSFEAYWARQAEAVMVAAIAGGVAPGPRRTAVAAALRGFAATDLAARQRAWLCDPASRAGSAATGGARAA